MHHLIDKKNRITIYLIFLIILGTTSNKTLENKKENQFRINNINVFGLSNNYNLQVTKKLNNLFYTNVFMMQKNEINKIISEFPIIEQYSIKKIYPTKLDIDITPTKFIAKISNNNKFYVGANGKLIPSKTINEKLPYLLGEFDSLKFLKFKKNIDSSKLKFIDFKTLTYYPSSRWDILMNNGILIKLPRKKNPLEALNFAYAIMKNNKFKNIKIIDLRISNQIIVQ